MADRGRGSREAILACVVANHYLILCSARRSYHFDISMDPIHGGGEIRLLEQLLKENCFKHILLCCLSKCGLKVLCRAFVIPDFNNYFGFEAS